MSETLRSGTELAHYRIVGPIGAGGMGEVYEARDGRLQRSVALKILPPHLVADADRVRRFVQEARAASGLNHPHIVTIHDIGEESSIHYIAMELIAGQSLREKLGREPLRDIVRWLAQAAEGVAKAHAAGIVHRDLKPENIMITADGYAKVLDFGLAKLTQRPEAPADATLVRETTEGIVLGTVAYMSPEQVQGKKVDHRSDIFSLGIILHEAATGALPFDGETSLEMMHNILRLREPDVRDPRVPGALRKLIGRCLIKDPEQRLQSMKDLAIELAAIAGDWNELATEGTPPLAEPRRKRTATIAIPGAAIAIAIIAGVLLLRRDRATPVTTMTFAPLTNMPGMERYPAISPDGNYVAYQARAGDDTDIFLLRIGGRNPINLTESSSADDGTPAFSPDGRTIAFHSTRDGGGIFLMGATGESVRRLTSGGFFPAWSPDGTKIVHCTDRMLAPYYRTVQSRLWVVDVATGASRKIHDGDAMHPRWSPDGKRIAFWGFRRWGGGQRDLATIPAGGGAVEWLTSDAAFDWFPLWAPDGKSIWFSSDRGGTFNVWHVGVDPATGKATGAPQPRTTPAGLAAEMDLSRDGTKLAFNSWNVSGNLARIAVDPKTMKPASGHTLVTRGTTELLGESDVSPDGAWLVARTLGQEDLVVVRSDGTQRRQLTDDPARDRGPRWTPDGQWIVLYSARGGNFDLWRIRLDGSGLQQLTKRPADATLWHPFVSPDGTKIAGYDESGTVIFDISGPLPATRFEQLPPISPDRIFLGQQWSPDGREILGVAADAAKREFRAIVVWNAAARTYETLLEANAMRVCRVPGEKRIAWTDGSAIRIYDPGTRTNQHIAAFSDVGVGRISIPRDRSAIYFSLNAEESDLWLGTAVVP